MTSLLVAFEEEVGRHRPGVFALLHRYAALDRKLLLASDLVDELATFLDGEAPELRGGPLERLLRSTQEAAVDPPWICFAVRPAVAEWRYLRLHLESLDVEAISPRAYLRVKERLFGGEDGGWVLELDLAPFERGFPKLQESRSIGRGVEFLNRRLSSQLFGGAAPDLGLLVDFLRLHHHRGSPLLLSPRAGGVEALRESLREAEAQLAALPPETPWSRLAAPLEALGFLPGWGRDAARCRETMSLLTQILEAPDPATLEAFLARVPMIFSVAILSPHGYFGQDGVLGLPDTGGQVVYILDQVRALEQEMNRRLADQGLEIEPRILVVTRLIPEARGTGCDQRWEAVAGTRGAHILRVPFRDQSGRLVERWISRFEVWPYLERFAADVEREILAELQGRPDLVIGNYSDGNLVATLLARRLEVTQCAIAHALEKSKYLLSDLCWRENERAYHFGCQFTADLIAINAADFIIASTYQEIAGSESSVGQYESYGTFTMPGLYRVLHGVDVFDPKFNIVSPGADARVYFPHREGARRLTSLHTEIETLVDGEADGRTTMGERARPSRTLIFSMARLDRIKNLTGLAGWYADSPRLQEVADLLLVGGHVRPEDSDDREEREQAERMHSILDRPELTGKVRWVGARLDKNLVGELYRWIADRGGVFVQPALFEAFGLTVIEAMISGLPTFATRYGGPLEIIEHGESGFHLDPNHGGEAADLVADFLERCRDDPSVWEAISQGGIARVRRRYTWELYAERLMTLSRVYGFWKFVTDLDRQETARYLEMFYALQLRPLAQAMASEHGQRPLP